MAKARTRYSSIRRKTKGMYAEREKANIANLAKQNSCAFWKKLKRKNSKCVTNLSIPDFLRHFKRIFGDQNRTNNRDLNVENNLEIEEFGKEISVDEITKAINSLKKNYSSGPNNLV